MSRLSECFLSEIPEKQSESFLSEVFLPKVFRQKVFDFNVCLHHDTVGQIMIFLDKNLSMHKMVQNVIKVGN